MARGVRAAAYTFLAMCSLFAIHLVNNKPGRVLVTVVDANTGDVISAPAHKLTKNATSFAVRGKACRLPQAIMIGAKKCGTGAFHAFLGAHPSVALGRWETHFFDKASNGSIDFEAYRRRMPVSREGQVTMESTPAYFTTPGVPQMLKAMNSSIRLLLVVRNPVTRILSDYNHNRMQGHGHELFKVSMTDERKRELEAAFGATGMPSFEWLVFHNDFAKGAVDDTALIVRTGMYAVQLRRWLRIFPRSQIHIVDGDGVVEEPWREIEKVESFLNIPHVIDKDRFAFVESKGFYCMKNSTGHPQCLGKDKGRKQRAYDEQVMQKLRDFYRPHNEDFFALVGRRFNWFT